MGIFPDWLKEFPGELWDTFKKNAQENWPEFKQELVGGTKKVLEVPGKIIATVAKPLYRPFIIIGIVALLLLIVWNKLIKKGFL